MSRVRGGADLVRVLAEIGPRPAGSAAADAAATAIAEAFAALGLAVEDQPFRFLRYDPELPRLEVDGVAYEARPCMYSPPTANGGVTGRLAPVGRHVLLPGVFEGEAYAIEDPEGGGELGRLFTNPLGPAASFMSAYGQALVPPAAYVSAADGRRLAELTGATVSLRTRATFVPGAQERNVIARLDGDGVEVLVVCAHFDSAWSAPGIVDNATGIEGLRRVAAALTARPRLPRSVLFCAFAAEEVGLLGSRYFVTEAKMRGELGRIRGVVNLDCIAHGDELQIWAGPEDLRATAVAAAQAMGLHDRYALVEKPPGPGSDHFPFAMEDIPAVGILHFPYPEYHADERLELVDERRMDDSVALALTTIDHLLERRP